MVLEDVDSTGWGSKQIGAIAQLGERYNGIVEVGGSIPPSSTNNNSLKRLDFYVFLFSGLDNSLGKNWEYFGNIGLLISGHVNSFSNHFQTANNQVITQTCVPAEGS